MKIGDAKTLFHDWGDSLSQGYDALIEQNKEENSEKGMCNDNYCHALFFTDYMFRATQHDIRMLSGEEGAGFLCTLRKSFEEALKRITRFGGDVRIILVNSKKTDFLSAMIEKYPILKLTHASLKGDKNVPHTIICDDHMLREEDIHEKLTDESDTEQVTAKVYFNSNVKAKLATESFDDTWNYLNEG